MVPWGGSQGKTPPMGKCTPRKQFWCLSLPHMPFDPTTTAKRLTRSTVGSDLPHIGDLGGKYLKSHERPKSKIGAPASRRHDKGAPPKMFSLEIIDFF